MPKFKLLHGSIKLSSDQTVRPGEVVELDDAFAASLGASVEKVKHEPKSESKPAQSSTKPPEVK